MLTREEILALLKLVGEKTVVRPSPGFPYRVSQEGHGYSDDPGTASLQGKLSIMLEAAGRRG